jgi:hypothetical protein
MEDLSIKNDKKSYREDDEEALGPKQKPPNSEEPSSDKKIKKKGFIYTLKEIEQLNLFYVQYNSIHSNHHYRLISLI